MTRRIRGIQYKQYLWDGTNIATPSIGGLVGIPHNFISRDLVNKVLVQSLSRLSGPAGILLLLIGIAAFVSSARANGYDFDASYHASGRRFLSGVRNQVVSGDPRMVLEAAEGRAEPVVIRWYPGQPSLTAFCALFAAFPQPAARVCWIIAGFGTMLAGIWLCLAAVLPGTSVSTRVFLLGLAACSSSVRLLGWNLNAAAFPTGGLGFLIYGLLRRKDGFAVFGAWLSMLKLNMFLPVFGFMLWRKRPKLALAVLALIAFVDITAASRTGVLETYAGVRLTLASYTLPNTPNDPDVRGWFRDIVKPPEPVLFTPGVWVTGVVYGPPALLHWQYMFSSFTPDRRLAGVFATVAAIASFAALAYLWRKGRFLRDQIEWYLRGFLVINCLAMVVLPHGYYDLSYMLHSFFISIALVRLRNSRADWVCAVSSFLLAFAIMQGRGYMNWVFHVAKPLHSLILIPIYSYVLTICAISAIWGLRRYIEADTSKILITDVLFSNDVREPARSTTHQ